MTPKDKAQELIHKFIRFHRNGIYNVVHEDIAKQYALIAVDEILFSNNTFFETNIPHECWKYWIEVKQEIEKL